MAHHVTPRGNNQHDVFFVDEDRRGYLWYLRERAERYDLTVSAFCLTTNPIHLVTHAWEYPWSRAGAYCGESGDVSGMLALSEWFEEMPVVEWKATLNALTESDGVIEGLRIHTRTGRPKGSKDKKKSARCVYGRKWAAKIGYCP